MCSNYNWRWCQIDTSSKTIFNRVMIWEIQSHQGFSLLIKAYNAIIIYSSLNTHQFSAKLPLCNFEISFFLLSLSFPLTQISEAFVYPRCFALCEWNFWWSNSMDKVKGKELSNANKRLNIRRFYFLCLYVLNIKKESS
jgi:hypothetical protein